MSEVKLGPCPLCEGQATLRESAALFMTTVSVMCTKCGFIIAYNTEAEVITQWNALTANKATHTISAVHFTEAGEVDLTWENIETGETASLTAKVDAADGHEIAKVVPPLIFSGARADEIPHIDLGREMLLDLQVAADNSEWMPEEYSTSDWHSDLCKFLTHGPEYFKDKT